MLQGIFLVENSFPKNPLSKFYVSCTTDYVQVIVYIVQLVRIDCGFQFNHVNTLNAATKLVVEIKQPKK